MYDVVVITTTYVINYLPNADRNEWTSMLRKWLSYYLNFKSGLIYV